MSVVHTVRQGEYLSLIALAYGFADWKRIYDHADNAEFRRKRPNPNLIYPGDRIVIPDLAERAERGATDARHRFRARRPRRELRITFLDIFQKPLAEQTLEMRLDTGEKLDLETDGEGSVHAELPLKAGSARARIAGYEFDLMFSHLDPATTVSGIQARLNNLGYWAGRVDGIYGPLTAGGMAGFQRAQVEEGLEVGEFGQPERESLQRLALVHDGEDTVGEEEIQGRFYSQYKVTDAGGGDVSADDSADGSEAGRDDGRGTQAAQEFDAGDADGEEADEPSAEWV